MKMEISAENKNVLTHRTEVRFVVDHEKEATPGRNAVAEELAKKYNTKRDCVVVDDLSSVFGVGKTQGYAKIYDTKKDALEFENDYMLKRNGIEAPKAENAAPADAPKE